MSIRAVAWALDQPCPSPLSKLVLVKLADAANEEGECSASQARMAIVCGVSRETINRQLKILAQAGVLEVRQRFTDKGQQANHYFLRCDVGSHLGVMQDHTPPCDAGSHPPVITGSHHNGRVSLNPEASEVSIPPCHPPSGNDIPPHAQVRARGEETDFVKFYQAYPRHEARRAAEKAWKGALKRASPEAILAGVERYAEQRSGEDKQFTKLPATWLNADCWTDGEEDGRGRARPDREISKEERQEALVKARERAGIFGAVND